MVIDDYPAEKLAAKNADKVVKLDDALTEEEYAIAMPKGSDLVDVVNGVIKDLKDSGELNKIIDKYIGDDTESGASSAVETAESAAE